MNLLQLNRREGGKAEEPDRRPLEPPRWEVMVTWSSLIAKEVVEKCPDAIQILKAELRVLTDDVDVKCRRSRAIMNDSTTLTLLSIC